LTPSAQGKEMQNEVIIHPNAEIVESAGVAGLLDSIRPHWKGKRLIERVELLLRTDPSSACQRILNAAIQDLREKIVIAGIDIAKEAAAANRLSAINRPEDVENYSISSIIDLSHYIGILSRSEWRRLTRCYEIRRDLEHEDDEYEAGVEDCVYIFKTAIDVVLSKDPIKVISVTDIVGQIESPIPIALGADYLSDYEHAPKQRQIDIIKMLIGRYKQKSAPDILKTNSITCLRSLSQLTQNTAKVELGAHYQTVLGRNALSEEDVFLMNSAGLLPYFNVTVKDDYFNSLLLLFNRTGYHWKKWNVHSELLQKLIDAGELNNISPTICDGFIVWMFKCYLGEQGGYGAGYNRRVFYSDSGAPICLRIISNCKSIVSTRLNQNPELKREIERQINSQDIKRRYDYLLDQIEF